MNALLGGDCGGTTAICKSPVKEGAIVPANRSAAASVAGDGRLVGMTTVGSCVRTAQQFVLAMSWDPDPDVQQL